jgi:hypothetical protein
MSLNERSSVGYREVVAVFDREDALHQAVEEFHCHGFERGEVTISPPRRVVEKEIGHALKSVAEVEDEPGIPRRLPADRASMGLAQGAVIAAPLYIAACTASIAFASAGAALADIAIAGLMAGAIGATLGLIPVMWMRRMHRHEIEELLGLGGLVLWVQTTDKAREQQAELILARHRARDVHFHGLATA